MTPEEKINYALSLVEGADEARGRIGLPVSDPLIPAALRLALAVEQFGFVYDNGYREPFGEDELEDALDAFLALLPEPSKDVEYACQTCYGLTRIYPSEWHQDMGLTRECPECTR